MVTYATKRYREFFAFGLLGVAALYVVSGISVLFKSRDDSFLDFSGRAALISHTFMHPIVVLALAAAVMLVIAWGEASPHARVITLAVVAVGAIALVFGLVSWLAGLTADGIDGLPAYGGVVGAGKVVGVFLGVAQLGLLGLVVFFAATVLPGLPRPLRAQPQGWGQQYGGPPPGWGQQGQWSPPQQPAPWGQQPGPGGWQGPPQQQGWGPPQQPGWGHQPHGEWGQQAGGWGQQAPQPGPPPSAWTPQAPAQPPGGWTSSWEPNPADIDESAPDAVPAEPGAHLGEDPVVEPKTAQDPVAEPPAPAADETLDDVADDVPEVADDGTDNSGWWRPSSS